MRVEHTSARWGFVWLERLWLDAKYGCRMLASSPGFTVIAVLSLAIGIGANCAIFSFADALLLRPLPVARPGEVFTVGSTSSLEALSASSLVSSYPDYVDIRDRSESFEGLAAFDDVTVGFTSDPKAPPKLKMGMLVSGNLFSLMGVEPAIGRAFRPEENQVPGRDAVVVLGRAMWEQEFGSDPAVLGRTVRINGTDFTVIGVAPPEFSGMDQYVRSDFFVPLMMSSRLIERSEDRVARGARCPEPEAQGAPRGGGHAGEGPGRVDDDRRRSPAEVSGHQQEPRSRHPHRAAGEDRRSPRRTPC